MLACESNAIYVVEALAKHNVNINDKNRRGYTGLMFAVLNHCV